MLLRKILQSHPKFWHDFASLRLFSLCICNIFCRFWLPLRVNSYLFWLFALRNALNVSLNDWSLRWQLTDPMAAYWQWLMFCTLLLFEPQVRLRLPSDTIWIKFIAVLIDLFHFLFERRDKLLLCTEQSLHLRNAAVHRLDPNFPWLELFLISVVEWPLLKIFVDVGVTHFFKKLAFLIRHRHSAVGLILFRFFQPFDLLLVHEVYVVFNPFVFRKNWNTVHESPPSQSLVLLVMLFKIKICVESKVRMTEAYILDDELLLSQTRISFTWETELGQVRVARNHLRVKVQLPLSFMIQNCSHILCCDFTILIFTERHFDSGLCVRWQLSFQFH